MARSYKPRVCSCCGEAKPAAEFNHNPRRGTYIAHCKECGVWLTLLRSVFGPTRDWERNRQRQRRRDFDKAARVHQAASTPLVQTIQTLWR